MEAFFPQPLWITSPFPGDNLSFLGITWGLHSDKESITTFNRHPAPFPSIQYTPCPPIATWNTAWTRLSQRVFPPFNRPYYNYYLHYYNIL